MRLLILYFISVLASSSTVVLMKSLRDEQVAEGQLLPNIQAGFIGGTAKQTEKRDATF
jgi:hypothetical protein